MGFLVGLGGSLLKKLTRLSASVHFFRFFFAVAGRLIVSNFEASFVLTRPRVKLCTHFPFSCVSKSFVRSPSR